jgi:hypothetical protein
MSESRQHRPAVGTRLGLMTTTRNDAAAPTSSADTLVARPIPAADLDEVRARGVDALGNPVQVLAAVGEGEPLRCCLRYARAGESIALISYSPAGHGVWREVGPVYVHADACPGPTSTALPEELRTGPRVLRAYRPDGSMNYARNTLVSDDEDLDGPLRRLLQDPEVGHVHVRTVLPQCFLYNVTLGRSAASAGRGPEEQ